MALLSIAVVSDVICPWCYVGKRRLELALDHLGLRERVELRWLPFELNPDMPPDGMERVAYRAAKFGDHKSAELDRQMAALGREEGIMFALERQHRVPNTRKAHCLIAHASRLGTADGIVEALFRAYFEAGVDIGDTEVLADIAKQSGFEREQALTALQDVSLDAEVRELERQATRTGVSGVPFFIINDTWAISGAQPAPQWIDALRDILSRPAEAGQPQPAA